MEFNCLSSFLQYVVPTTYNCNCKLSYWVRNFKTIVSAAKRLPEWRATRLKTAPNMANPIIELHVLVKQYVGYNSYHITLITEAQISFGVH